MEKLSLLGLGDEPTPAQARAVFRQHLHQERERLPDALTIDLGADSYLAQAEQEDVLEHLRAIVTGCLLATYDLGFAKSQPAEPLDTTITLLVPEALLLDAETALAEGVVLGESQLRAMHLVNLPPNHLKPSTYAEEAEDTAETYGLELRILDAALLQEEGLHALHAVGRGSQDPARLIILEYWPLNKEGADLPTIGLVGKGLTFDTGGLNLKRSENLYFMKSDMGGSAAVLGAAEAIARLQLPVHLVAMLAIAENKTGADAFLPGDVLPTYSGKTVEVIDTDAEGRLVLADALTYMTRNYAPDMVIDLATLTGAAYVALGEQAAALFSNNSTLSELLTEAGEAVGERVWPLPLWPEYDRQLASDIADLKNYGGPGAGSITAAKFLQHFIEGHANWAHIDLPGMVYTQNAYGSMRNGTGYGVHLLVAALSEWLARQPEASQ